MTNAEQYWIWQQEQPTDVLIVGNHKRIKPVTVVYADIPPSKTNDDWVKLEDDLIEKHIKDNS